MAKSILITENLYQEISIFCKANEIADIDKYCEGLLQRSILIEKYGTQPVAVGNKIAVKNTENIDKQEEKTLINNKNTDDYEVYD